MLGCTLKIPSLLQITVVIAHRLLQRNTNPDTLRKVDVALKLHDSELWMALVQHSDVRAHKKVGADRSGRRHVTKRRGLKCLISARSASDGGVACRGRRRRANIPSMRARHWPRRYFQRRSRSPKRHRRRVHSLARKYN